MRESGSRWKSGTDKRPLKILINKLNKFFKKFKQTLNIKKKKI